MANDSSRVADLGLRRWSWPRIGPITRTKLETTASFVLVAALSAVTLLWGLSSLWLPYGWDHGVFAYLSDTILRGGMPYRDALDFKGPLTFYIFAALQAAFGRQMWAIRAFDLVLLASAGLAGVRIGSRFVSRRAATCTMLVLVLAFASFGNWYTAQPDGWAALGLFVVVALLVGPEPPGARAAALASAIIGACMLFKPFYGVYMGLVLCALWPRPVASVAGWRPFVASGVAAIAGLSAPLVVAVTWFAAHGALASFFDVYIRFNLERATDATTFPFARVWAVTLGVPTCLPVLGIALPAAAFGLGFVVRRERRSGIVIGLWVLTSLVIIGLQRKFFLHNYSWLPYFLSLGFVAGLGLAKLWTLRASEMPGARWLVIVAAAACVKLLLVEPAAQITLWGRYVTGRISYEQYLARFDDNLFYGSASKFGFSVPRDFRIAAYLRERTGPSEKVLVWSDPLVSYLAGRVAITPITVADAFTVWGSEPRRQRYRADLLAEMRSPDAAYFGIAQRDLSPGDDEQNVPAHFPELLRELESDYEPVEAVGDVRLFRRRR
jgi:hypothetical protein